MRSIYVCSMYVYWKNILMTCFLNAANNRNHFIAFKFVKPLLSSLIAPLKFLNSFQKHFYVAILNAEYYSLLANDLTCLTINFGGPLYTRSRFHLYTFSHIQTTLWFLPPCSLPLSSLLPCFYCQIPSTVQASSHSLFTSSRIQQTRSHVSPLCSFIP